MVLKNLMRHCLAKTSFIVHRGKKVSNKEYQNDLKVWNKLEMKTMKDYYELYLKCDVLLLADVFETFRNRCLEIYGLCPNHYLITPALSWDAIFNTTIVELDLT